MSIRLLVDMNLSPAWVQVLERHGWQAIHWSKVGDPTAPDHVIMAWAQANGHVVFTHDLDFGAILAASGAIVEKRVTLHRQVRGSYVLIEDVPAGVCAECGMRYYAANVLKTIEESIRGRLKAQREVVVPVYSLQLETYA